MEIAFIIGTRHCGKVQFGLVDEGIVTRLRDVIDIHRISPIWQVNPVVTGVVGNDDQQVSIFVHELDLSL